MNRRYLAYGALLAGWVVFCYWLYAKNIAPLLEKGRETSRPPFDMQVPYPVAYRWASAQPVSGSGYEEWIAGLSGIEAEDDFVILRGYYFRDEAATTGALENLARKRVESMLPYLGLDPERVLVELLPQQVNADVRSFPFEAIRYERNSLHDLIWRKSDTLEICFPLKDSLILPAVIVSRINALSVDVWTGKDQVLYIIGTADASGLAEPADMGLERALIVKSILIQSGWQEDQIVISGGQRNDSLSLRNRCVVMYME